MYAIVHWSIAETECHVPRQNPATPGEASETTTGQLPPSKLLRAVLIPLDIYILCLPRFSGLLSPMVRGQSLCVEPNLCRTPTLDTSSSSGSARTTFGFLPAYRQHPLPAQFQRPSGR